MLAEGQVNGHIADVVERYELSDRDPKFESEAPRLLAGARADLLRIRAGIEGGVAIRDLQFLVKPGHVVVSDPLGLIVREQNPAEYAFMHVWNLREVDSLIAKSN